MTHATLTTTLTPTRTSWIYAARLPAASLALACALPAAWADSRQMPVSAAEHRTILKAIAAGDPYRTSRVRRSQERIATLNTFNSVTEAYLASGALVNRKNNNAGADAARRDRAAL